MSKERIEHTCGHFETHIIVGPGSIRKRKYEWLKTTVCSDCFHQQIEDAKIAANVAAAAKSADLELPALTGTEKQIEWATTLRLEWLDYALKYDNDPSDLFNKIWAISGLVIRERDLPDDKYDSLTSEESLESLKDTLEVLLYDWAVMETTAKFWIENKSNFSYYASKVISESVIDVVNAWLAGEDLSKHAAIAQLKIDTDARLAEEEKEENQKAAIEATILAKEPLSSLIVKLETSDNLISISIGEKNTVFRSTMKGLGYRWSPVNHKWSKTVSNQQDAFVEAAYTLLFSGFNVRIFDPVLRQRVIEGDYIPDNPCKVLAYKSTSELSGKFCITWPRNKEYYDLAKRIRGARYVKPDIAVPGESFEEVIDFAERHGFKLTNAALALIEQQKAIIENAMTADVVKKPSRPEPNFSDTPLPLPVPAIVTIPSSLMDDEEE